MSKSKYVVKEGKAIATYDLDTYPVDSEHYLTDNDFIISEMNHVLGKVLTIVDASVIGGQNKAIKDLIKTVFINEYVHLSEILSDPEWLEESKRIPENMTDEEFESLGTEVDTDEILGLK